MSAADPFLGVARSLTGRRWEGPTLAEARAAETLEQRAALHPVVAAVLARRGIAPEAAPAFLAPTLRELLPDPDGLRDMGAAAARLIAALEGRQRIAVFADYDVDGATSAALLLVWLRALGSGATLYVPDRIGEGYGPNVPAMTELGRGHDLIICVDCGTVSHAPVAAARAEGADVIVLDHHLATPELPPALAVVNPNRLDEDGSLSHLCAAAVVFLLLVEANRRLRQAGREGPDLLALLDLVALATVADVAPLVGVNRAFVRQGLSIMARRERPGLAALADVAQLGTAPTARALGFVLGPRINAGGRVGRADLGARLLASNDPAEAARLADELERLNTERRAVEAAVRAEAIAQAEARGADRPLAWAAGEGWHPGVVGIVAARLKEALVRPSIVFGIDGGVAKGSARSVEGIDIGRAVQKLVAEGHALAGGGHRMAAGLSVAREGLAAAMARLETLILEAALAGGGQAEGGELRALRIDALLGAGALGPQAGTDLVRRLEAAGPFGAAAPAPRLALAAQVMTGVQRVGAQHLRLSFGSGRERLDTIAFGAFEGALGPALEGGRGRRWHLAGRVEISHWGGRERVEFRLEDAAPA